MVEFCAIASGSNGNCYYVGNEMDAVLIDAGINCRMFLKRMAIRGLSAEKIRAVFVSHEHADHCRGLSVFSKRLNIPVYITEKTRKRIRTYLRISKNLHLFVPGDSITIGSLTVHSFLKKHDAIEPCGFRIEYDSLNVGVFTDLGSICDQVIYHASQCQALFLETNYDETLLWEGSYSQILKKRISSDNGHLSNSQALELVRKHCHSNLQMVLLSHLSSENNRPEIALSVFDEMKNRFRIELTDRHAPSEVFTINN